MYAIASILELSAPQEGVMCHLGLNTHKDCEEYTLVSLLLMIFNCYLKRIPDINMLDLGAMIA